jgi:hypothetical protein
MIKNLFFSSRKRKSIRSINFTKTPLNFAKIVFAQNTSYVSLKELKWGDFCHPIEPHHQEEGESGSAHPWGSTV